MNDQANLGAQRGDRHARHGHGLMMIACCIPMLVITVLLVATGVAGSGVLLAALACTAMMALVMRGMAGSDTRERHG
jgi:hypothetical protein